MIQRQDYLLLAPAQRYLLFLMTFTWGALDLGDLRKLARSPRGIPVHYLTADLCKGLEKRHLLQKEDYRQGYRLGDTLSLDGVQEMVGEADREGWWPELSVWEDFVSSSGRSYHTIGDQTRALFRLRCAELLARAVRASGQLREAVRPRFAKLKPTEIGEIARSAAWIAYAHLEGLGSAFCREADALTDEFLADYLNLALREGTDVRPQLHVLAERFASPEACPPRVLAENFLALAAWCGRTECFDLPALKKFEAFAVGCKSFCAGECAAADKIFRRMVENDRARPSDFDNLPVRLLMFTACCLAKPEKLPKTRPVQIMRGNLYDPYNDGYGTALYAYDQAACNFAGEWARAWKSVLDGGGWLLPEEGRSFVDISAVTALLPAWSWQTLVLGRAGRRNRAAILLAPYREAARRGYVNLAGLGLSLLTGCYSDADVSAELAEVEAHGTWLLPRVAPDPEWKSVVGLLRGALEKAEKAGAEAATQTGQKLFWGVEFGEPDLLDNVSIRDIHPYLRKDGCKAGGTNEIRLSFADCQKAKYKGYFAEADLLLLAHLKANSDYYYSDNVHVNETIVAALCGRPNLERRTEVYSSGGTWGRTRRSVEVVPITFERVACQLASKVLEGGGVDFSLPEWALETVNTFVVRQKKDEDVYQYVPLDAGVKKILEVFRKAGDKGRIVFPPESMADAADVLSKLTALIPVAAPSAQEVANLPRVPAKTDITVRLDYDGEARLVIRAVVLPIAENAGTVVEPGIGLPEKVVGGPAGNYLLVRDLAAEQASFARVKAALAASEDWFDGRSTWTIEEIPSAIEALSNLKALEPPVPLEWIDQRRLDVAFAPKSGVALESSRTAEEWFSVKGSFTLDTGRVLGVMELLAALPNRAGRYVRLSNGAFVSLTNKMMREMEALAAAGHRKGGALEIPRAALPMLDKAFEPTAGEEGLELPEVMAKSADEIRAVLARRPVVPKTLQAQLRPYQVDGYRWLSRLAACGFGACLADDMGLGKTLQVISLLLERAGNGPSLVVAPASVCGNWRREIQRFAPTLVPILAMEREDAGAAAGPNDVVIASYGFLLFHEDALVPCKWNGLVLDEAQAIKNDASKRAHLVKRFTARFRIAATGTPVENRLGELWSLFDFLNPGLLGPAASFAQRFTVEGRAKPELKKLVKPLILRRLKGEVLDDLPEKTEITLSVNLGAAERSAYEGCRLHALAALQDKDEDDRISILAELTRLRRFCCHPSLVLGASDVPSAKMEALVDLLGELHDGHHRALVFSQFTDYLALVRQVVEPHGWTYQYLDGSTPTLERERRVNAFQGGEGDFFLISLKAGGTGLNLTAANYVILLDPWWNPAVENQAADRAHRIGQTQPVTIYRLVSADTVEERVIELHKQKNALAADLLEGTSNASFTSKDLMNLFRK